MGIFSDELSDEQIEKFIHGTISNNLSDKEFMDLGDVYNVPKELIECTD